MKSLRWSFALIVISTTIWIGTVARHGSTPLHVSGMRPPGMVRVPAGDFLMGSDDPDADDDARPAHRVKLAEYWIDRTEVTNAEFSRFDASCVFSPGEERLPVTNVTFDQAAA